MCLAELDVAQQSRPGPNPCPIHPHFDMGRYSAFCGYQRNCADCIIDAINALKINPEKFGLDVKPDIPTIELVLDVLYQKFGL